MIKNKSDLKYYLERDRIALGKTGAPKLIGDYIYKFQVAMRKYEYYANTGKLGILGRFHKLIYQMLGYKLGFAIPINTFESGLCIAHFGTIVVSKGAKIGKNCKIHEGVTIGATNGCEKAATIGDNVFIASGAKIIGDVQIANDVAIGANAVVVKSITEAGTTWGGVPAKKISDHNSHSNLNKGLFV